jgi:hypothetical protein
MGYNDLYKSKKVVSLYDETAGGTFKFTNDSPQIVGKFIRQDIYRKNILSAKSMMYTFDTDSGEKTFFLSGATDKIIRNTLIPGQIYAILFLGKKKTSKGREMNNFRIEHIVDLPRDPEPKKRVVRRRTTTTKQVETTNDKLNKKLSEMETKYANAPEKDKISPQ